MTQAQTNTFKTQIAVRKFWLTQFSTTGDIFNSTTTYGSMLLLTFAGAGEPDKGPAGDKPGTALGHSPEATGSQVSPAEHSPSFLTSRRVNKTVFSSLVLPAAAPSAFLLSAGAIRRSLIVLPNKWLRR